MTKTATSAPSTVLIDPEFEALIPPLSSEERAGLERSLLAEGCRDALVVWREHGILLDGHNRYALCKIHGIEFRTVELSFRDRIDAKLWMLRNQLGRRNIDTLTRVELASALEAAIAEKAKANLERGRELGGVTAGRGRPSDSSLAKSPESYPPIEPINTRVEAANAAGLSEFTYRVAKQVLASGTDRLKQAVRQGVASISAAAEIAALPAEQQDEIVEKGEKAIVAAAKEAKHHRTQGTGENEWYTPKLYLDAARAVLGKIDLDPASSDTAQANVKAARHFTIDDNGLERPWRGRVWMNPPYAQPAIEHFMRKLVAEVAAGNVTEAIALTHNYTDTVWFHHAAEAATAVCFTRGRIRFESPDGKLAAPTQGQAFFYYGKNVDRFAETFRSIGFVARLVHG